MSTSTTLETPAAADRRRPAAEHDHESLTKLYALEPHSGQPTHKAIRNATYPNMNNQERNKQCVIRHFDDFVNKKDLAAIDRNMAADFLDHDGPGGKRVGPAEDRAMMAAMHQLMPDLKVEVKDALAEGDKVVVRNLWTGTNAKTGQRVEFHGFVLWRLNAEGKIAERWATVTPLHELAAQTLAW